ncbi:toxin-antitoxin system YwqK family antitoxin [Winogradskyella sp. PE311]|uniref:toxin-antitoxin system YwqK family antitoxin n=1 Tax=Winogradskyella sp. PE311 TaxID=3366943 RepID=UPI00397F9A4E
MKFVFTLITILTITSFSLGQTTIDVSKIQTVKENGIKISTFNGKPFSGHITESFSNGKPKSWQTIKDGLANGLWQEWYENGQLKYSAFWLDGKGHGLWEYYHENGVLRQEEFYDMDIPIGIFKFYFNNGQTKSKTSWMNGKKHGIWNYYNENGLLQKTEVYEYDELISTKSD